MLQCHLKYCCIAFQAGVTPLSQENSVTKKPILGFYIPKLRFGGLKSPTNGKPGKTPLLEEQSSEHGPQDCELQFMIKSSGPAIHAPEHRVKIPKNAILRFARTLHKNNKELERLWKEILRLKILLSEEVGE